MFNWLKSKNKAIRICVFVFATIICFSYGTNIYATETGNNGNTTNDTENTSSEDTTDDSLDNEGATDEDGNTTSEEGTSEDTTDNTKTNTTTGTSSQYSDDDKVEVPTSIKDLSNAVVKIVVYYQDSAGTKHIVKQGSGFIIGTSDSSSNSQFIITDYDVVVDENEIKTKLTNQGIKTDQLNICYSAFCNVGLQVDLSVAYSSQDGNYAILAPSTVMSDATFLGMGDSTSLCVGEQLYVLGYGGNREVINIESSELSTKLLAIGSTLTNISVENINNEDRTYLSIRDTLEEGMAGAPILDSNGYLVGMIINRDGEMKILSVADLEKVFTTLGLRYSNGADDYDKVTPEMVNRLKELVEECKIKLKQENGIEYTNSSWNNLYTAVKTADTLLAGNSTSLKEYKDAITSLEKCEKKLRVKNFTFIIIDIIVAVILGVVIFLYVNNRMKGKKFKVVNSSAKQKPKDPAKIRIDVSGVLKKKENYNPGVMSDKFINQSISNEMRPVAPVQQVGVQPMPMQSAVPQQGFARLVQPNGQAISINPSGMIIGSDPTSVDYAITTSTSVSRNHARITCVNNAYYVTDTNSTNGTSVNGVVITPMQSVPLNKGDVVKFADVEFRFE